MTGVFLILLACLVYGLGVGATITFLYMRKGAANDE
jgi:hypothetical protein